MRSALRTALALALAFLLGTGLTAQTTATSTLRDQVAALAAGTTLDVSLQTGQRVTGRLVSATPTDFTLAPQKTKSGSLRTFAFAQTESIRVRPPKHTPAIAWIVTGAIVAVVVIAVAVLLAERHNEGAL